MRVSVCEMSINCNFTRFLSSRCLYKNVVLRGLYGDISFDYKKNDKTNKADMCQRECARVILARDTM